MIKSYLRNCWQRTKINATFSSWSELLIAIPLVSVLGPLLFNTILMTFFILLKRQMFVTMLMILHACNSDSKSLIQRLEHNSMLAMELFESNYMKLSKTNVTSFFLGMGIK